MSCLSKLEVNCLFALINKSPGESAAKQIRRGSASEIQLFFDFLRTKRRLKKHSGEKLVHKTKNRLLLLKYDHSVSISAPCFCI